MTKETHIKQSGCTIYKTEIEDNRIVSFTVASSGVYQDGYYLPDSEITLEERQSDRVEKA